MSMHIIENGNIRIEVNEKGAELSSIYSQDTSLEYLWSGDAAYWGKKSPVLFPIVGTLKNNKYHFSGREYELGRHGFARDMNFVLKTIDASSLTMSLESDASTLAVFPFPFRLEITYTIDGSKLHTDYRVFNTGSENMYFSIGAHPAFRIPLEKGLLYEDYYFEFSQTEHAKRWLISGEGLINPQSVPVMTDSNILPLSRDLFASDAIVLKHLNSDSVKLKTDKSELGIGLTFERFPYLGLWAAKGADFVCIEPWCGIADSTVHNQDFIAKEGINLLTPDEVFNRRWTLSVY